MDKSSTDCVTKDYITPDERTGAAEQRDRLWRRINMAIDTSLSVLSLLMMAGILLIMAIGYKNGIAVTVTDLQEQVYDNNNWRQ